MRKYVEQIKKLTFSDTNMKDAYMKMCKWLATNVISKEGLAKHLTYTITKEKGTNPTVTLQIFICIDEDAVSVEHCAICKEMHKSFFINEEVDCNRCKINGYRRRVDRTIEQKRNYVKEILQDVMEVPKE